MLRTTLPLLLIIALGLTVLISAVRLLAPTDTSIIVYAAQTADSDADLYIVDVAKRIDRRITRQPRADFLPMWSPDGSQLMWQSHRDGVRTIYLSDADGTHQRRLNTDPVMLNQHSPAWSPDGTQVVYAQQEDNGLVQLYLHTLATGDATRLTPDDYSAFMPVWSPDGSQIAFVHYIRYVDHVYRLDLTDDADAQPITPGYNRRIVHLDWSPTDDALTYGLNTENLRRATLDGDSTALVNGSLGVYAPDGARFAYVDGYNTRINMLNPEAEETRLLFDAATLGLNTVYITDLNWSPDGEWLAYTLETGGTTRTSAIYLMRADGSDRRRVSDPRRRSSSPDWRP